MLFYNLFDLGDLVKGQGRRERDEIGEIGLDTLIWLFLLCTEKKTKISFLIASCHCCHYRHCCHHCHYCCGCVINVAPVISTAEEEKEERNCSGKKLVLKNLFQNITCVLKNLFQKICTGRYYMYSNKFVLELWYTCFELQFMWESFSLHFQRFLSALLNFFTMPQLFSEKKKLTLTNFNFSLFVPRVETLPCTLYVCATAFFSLLLIIIVVPPNFFLLHLSCRSSSDCIPLFWFSLHCPSLLTVVAPYSLVLRCWGKWLFLLVQFYDLFRF